MKWAIDTSHSNVTFTIRHMMSKVRGQMKVKEGWIEAENDHTTAKVDVTLDADSGPLVQEAQTVAGVSRAESRGPVLRVFASRVGEAVPAILALAESRGRTVNDIQLSRPRLETLFISLTGRKLS